MKLPNREELIFYTIQFLILSILFFVLYGLTNYLASKSQNHYSLYFEFEKNIPFLAPSIIIYLSINLIFVLPVFYLTIPEMKHLSFAFSSITILSCSIFYFFPTKLGWIRPGHVPNFEWIYSVLYSVEYPHNLFPSLHVAYSYLIFKILWPKTHLMEKILYRIWFFLLLSSVLFTHQHHLLDILGGIFFAEFGLKISNNWKWVWGNFFRTNRT